MQIEQTGTAELTINGNIKSIEDSLRIKDEINKILKIDSSRVKLVIKDSFSMTSTVIGFLMKLVHHDKVQLSLSIGDNRLYDLLDELNLVQAFNAFQRNQ